MPISMKLTLRKIQALPQVVVCNASVFNNTMNLDTPQLKIRNTHPMMDLINLRQFVELSTLTF